MPEDSNDYYRQREEAENERYSQQGSGQRGKFFINPHSPSLFLDLLNARRLKNMDSIIIVVGERRTGKSYGAISLAEKIMKQRGKKFNVSTNLFFDPLPFLKRFNEISDDVIILDEASESIDRRNWYDVQNKIFSSLIMREGFRRNTVILTFPVLSDLDTRATRMCSHLITMLGNNADKGYSIAMSYRLKPIHLAGKSFPRKLQMLKFSLPTPENKQAYDKMKVDWNKIVSERNIDTMKALEDPEYFKKPLSKDEYITGLKKGTMTREHFIKGMRKSGYADDDIGGLIKQYCPRYIKELAEKSPPRSKRINIIVKAKIDKDGSISYSPTFADFVQQSSE